MLAAMKKIIPITPIDGADSGSADSECDGAEAFALMVLGDSMVPEFNEGEVIVIEPAGLATDGSYVLAQAGGEWIFRQLQRCGERWRLAALNPAYAAIDIDDLAPVKGVIIQKSIPGRRKAAKRYVD